MIVLLLLLQGRHVKTGQLAAIKVMDVTEVSSQYISVKIVYTCSTILGLKGEGEEHLNDKRWYQARG